MKLKLILCLFLLIVGCQGQRADRFPWMQADTGATGHEVRLIRGVMMLPLSGKSQSIGQAFQNSGMMALQERPNSPMELIFLDTKGTPEGAREAWQIAKEQDPDVIIGPVFGTELSALKEEKISVPILSFTTNHELLEQNVYSLGILIPNQVERLVRFMCEAGQKRIAVIGPEDKTGELTMNRLAKTIERCPGMTLDKVSLYKPDTVNFNNAVLKIVPKPINPKKKNLTPEEQELLATPMADRLTFDALFIFEDGVKLQQVTSLLAYYDVNPKVVPFYGLANWQTTKDRSLIGGYYTATPADRMKRFLKRYQTIYGDNPPRIASLAYDAVSLTALLAERQALSDTDLTGPMGFNGVNGRFRLNPDGMNEHLLEIHQKTTVSRAITLSPEPDDFPNSDEPFPAPLPPEPEQSEADLNIDLTLPETPPAN